MGVGEQVSSLGNAFPANGVTLDARCWQSRSALRLLRCPSSQAKTSLLHETIPVLFGPDVDCRGQVS